MTKKKSCTSHHVTQFFLLSIFFKLWKKKSIWLKSAFVGLNFSWTKEITAKPMGLSYVGHFYKHWNPYIGYFQVTKTRDFSNFLKIIHKLTLFFTFCSAVWRKKRIKQSQEPQKRISIWKTLKSIYWSFSANKTLRC